MINYIILIDFSKRKDVYTTLFTHVGVNILSAFAINGHLYDQGFLNDIADESIGAYYTSFFVCMINVSMILPQTFGPLLLDYIDLNILSISLLICSLLTIWYYKDIAIQLDNSDIKDFKVYTNNIEPELESNFTSTEMINTPTTADEFSIHHIFTNSPSLSMSTTNSIEKDEPL